MADDEHLDVHHFEIDEQPLHVSSLTRPMQAFFDSGATRAYEWRCAQLRSLARLVTERADELTAALASDLGKTPMEGTITDLITTRKEVGDLLATLRADMAPTPVSSPGGAMPVYSCVWRGPPR